MLKAENPDTIFSFENFHYISIIIAIFLFIELENENVNTKSFENGVISKSILDFKFICVCVLSLVVGVRFFHCQQHSIIIIHLFTMTN